MSADPASLANLRDIALPPPVTWWPPQPGWWILAAALLALVLAGLRRLAQHWRRDAYRRAARAELAHLHQGDAAGLHELLKRTALAAWPRARVAGLTGTGWLGFLDATGGAGGFMTGPARKVSRAATDPHEVLTEADWRETVRLAALWIARHGADGSVP